MAKIVAIDAQAGTVTFADASPSTLGENVLTSQGATFSQGYLTARTTRPTPSTGVAGARCFALNDNCWATWSGDRWMYGEGFAESTANRPDYTSSAIYVGLSMFDTTLGKPIWWDGSDWVDATGSVV